MSMVKKGYGAIFLVAFLDMLGFGIIIPIIRDFTELMVDASDPALFSWSNAIVDFLKNFFDAHPTHLTPYVFLSGILMASYSFFQFIFAPILGRLSDKHGRKVILYYSIFGNVISYGLWAVSQSFEVLILSRIISGATGANISVAQSYLADVTEKEERSKAMGMMGALFGLGFILGPALGALLSKIDMSGQVYLGIKMNRFSPIGLATMGLSIINLIWVWLGVKEPERKTTSKTSTANIFKLLTHFKNKDLGNVYIVYFLMTFAFVHLESTLAWDVKDRFGLDAAQTGWFFVYMGVLLALVQGGLYRRLIKTSGERKLAQVGLAFAGVGLLIHPFAYPLWVMMLTLVIITVGLGMGNPSMTAIASFNAGDDQQGYVLGVVQSFGSLARVIAPITATFIYEFIGVKSPYVIAGLIFLVALLLSRNLPLKDSKSI